MKRYFGMCVTYRGRGALRFLRVPVLSIGLPVMAGSFAYLSGLQVDPLKAFLCGYSGLVGFAFAHEADKRVSKRLEARRVGIRRGGRVVRAFQMAAYAVPVVGALVIQPNAHDVSMADGRVRHVSEAEYAKCFQANFSPREPMWKVYQRCYAP